VRLVRVCSAIWSYVYTRGKKSKIGLKKYGRGANWNTAWGYMVIRVLIRVELENWFSLRVRNQGGPPCENGGLLGRTMSLSWHKDLAEAGSVLFGIAWGLGGSFCGAGLRLGKVLAKRV